jgi:hypothetical protein
MLLALDKRCTQQQATRSAVIRAALAVALEAKAEPARKPASPRDASKLLPSLLRAPVTPQQEVAARAEAVTKANASDTHCPKCGRSYALVGWSHLCTPTEVKP